ncbi:hypothetical protein LCM4573_21325 [Rhizobium sp. LCM 4573]|nr:hypothetical protein LCM4573_21325 [Rhizobium sp. LCM 4573]
MLEARAIAIGSDVPAAFGAHENGFRTVQRIMDAAVLQFAHKVPALSHHHLWHSHPQNLSVPTQINARDEKKGKNR